MRKEDTMRDYVNYYNEFIIQEHKEATELILDLAAKNLMENFRLKVDPKLIGVIYKVTFDTLMDMLKELSITYKKFTVDICGRLQVGFNCSVRRDIEQDKYLNKFGNIYLVIKDKKFNKTNPKAEVDDNASKSITRWLSANMKNNVAFLDKLSINAKHRLSKDFGCRMFKELVIPIFVTVYSSIVGYLNSCEIPEDEEEVSVNVMETIIVYATCLCNEDDEECDNVSTSRHIHITPSVSYKQLMKDDKIAEKHYWGEDTE